MLERPGDVTDESVRDAVRRHWHPGVDEVEHLAVGWGAHHWRATAAGEPVLFVTLDPPTARHTAASIEGAYAATAALELDFVWPPVPQLQGPFTLPLGERTVSVTRWLDGERPRSSTSDLPDLLGVLHRAPIPAAAPVWTTEVDPRVADRCRDLVLAPWDGPLEVAARLVLSEHMSQVAGWATEHTLLAGRADPSTYVVTHGEPGVHNQWRAQGRTWLIDWESLRRAPRERDLATLVHAGVATDGDPGMIRLFRPRMASLGDLELRPMASGSARGGRRRPHSARGPDRGTHPPALRRAVIRADLPYGPQLRQKTVYRQTQTELRPSKPRHAQSSARESIPASGGELRMQWQWRVVRAIRPCLPLSSGSSRRSDAPARL